MNDDPARPLDRSEGDINQAPARADWQREHLDDATRALLDEDARWFLHQSLSTPCLNALETVSGSELVDLQGRRYLDFHGNSVHQVGHANPAVLDAVRAQLDALTFCPRRYTNRPTVELARQLAERAPGGPHKVLFAPGGAAAVGMALKLARVATNRFKTLSWWDSFHGASLDAIGVGGEALFRRGVGPLLPGALHVPPPGARLRPEGPPLDPDTALDHARYVFDHEPGIAAFIAEPMRCTTVHIPPRAYWQGIRTLCDAHGALLVFDEIPICLGRTGHLFACEYTGVEPDMVCLGKGLGGGVVPMAALIARAELDVAGHVALGHYTHEKNPVGAAAALATLREIDTRGLVGRAATLGARALADLEALADAHACVAEVRGQGLVLGVELAGPQAVALAERTLYAALARGLSFKVSGGTVLTLMPPLTLTDDEWKRALDILDDSLRAAEEGTA